MVKSKSLLLCMILQTSVVFAALPSVETLNSGVFLETLKHLPPALDAVEEIIFVQRGGYEDPHWYANIGYFCDDELDPAYTTGAQLCKLNLKTGHITILLETEQGCIRDPKVHYDAQKILFAWRRKGLSNYNLYEINVDGTNIRQITSGPFDDYEPEYLPDGGIVFVSTRARRWVGCWLTQVGTIHRCNGDGTDIEMLSTNIEHDNTPSVLPNGKILYMRWEYVDRSQVEFHHLWTMNPDGTNQEIYYGNEVSWGVFLSCRPVPGDDRVLGIYSPGHGRNDHYGQLAFFSNQYGPDDPRGLEKIELGHFADPWVFSANTILAAEPHSPPRLVVVTRNKNDKKYTARALYEIKNNSKRWITQSPRPIIKRKREQLVVKRNDPSSATGTHIVVDVYNSQNLEGIQRGDIKKLLIIETLPKPVNFSGGPDTLSWLGSFNLERILGTVPVEPDGSAYFELPADRPVFYVALDKNDLSCKRMQSFTSVRPGETMSCIGCHNSRSHSHTNLGDARRIMALKREPSQITPIPGVPDVPDFMRDVQPVLDKYCIECHNTKDRKGRLSLEGDMGPTYSIPYYSLAMHSQIGDGRNGLGNQPPRSLGSSASPLLRKLEGGHHNRKASREDWLKVWAWTEAAAPFCGTYGGLRNKKQQNTQLGVFTHQANAILGRRCLTCHKPDGEGTAPLLVTPLGTDDWQRRRRLVGYPTGNHERVVIKNDPARYFALDVLVNATRPDQSAVLLAPLAKEAGGWGTCPNVFTSKQDPDYQKMARATRNWQTQWQKARVFGSPDFQVNHQYLREMVRFGILPEGTPLDQIDPYRTDQRYWKMFHYRPQAAENLVTRSLH